MNPHDTLPDTDEHVRFAAHLDELRQAADVDEVDLVRRVLTDPDPTMAQSAVLRHVDRRAAGLCHDPAYEAWVRAMAQAVSGLPFLTRRLREWSLLRAVTLHLPWHPDDLLTASNWLQLKAAATANTEARQVLAEAGRTKRIRNTAGAGLDRRAER
ncbi:hypothetical protein [Streptomyces sp. AS02]|uniref:hypothetical protein n=1 Tax=Streptomyces sp. AS02 TaxID=2938946 RepID=UPI002020139E|nr:hypothetical protein [Streptomyces sp. AS02]MCL8015569.1 hypothetical protein [Streptomyces sp. AS02]